MSTPSLQLLLNRFVSFNKARYADNTKFVQALDSLQVTDVTFENYRFDDLTEGYIVDILKPKLFTAYDQKYTPVDAMVNGVMSVVNDGTPVDISMLASAQNPGIYLIDPVEGITGVVVVMKGNKDAVSIRNVIKSSCAYELLDEEITPDGLLETVNINAKTIVGQLKVVESSVDLNTYFYNGTHTYDGTITY